MPFNLPVGQTDGETVVQYAVQYDSHIPGKQITWGGWKHRRFADQQVAKYGSFYPGLRAVKRSVEFRTTEWVEA